MCGFQIAIDGPAGAGKSTIAKKIAAKLNYIYIDTGAMYRALTYTILEKKISIENVDAIINLAENCVIEFRNKDIIINNKKVTEEIRIQQVNEKVSYIAQIAEVRKILVNTQKKIALNNNIVMDGRDIGTIVLPKANLKFFLTASVKERAKRRYNEMKTKNNSIDFNKVLEEIRKRDKIDENRKCSPLARADDAVTIDTTGLNIAEVVDSILITVKDALKDSSV
ncbi:MAG: (d)CMP kinase [Clostridiales bacterium]|nr:(d)CMP kinase [Clostridiales bacterium]